MIEPTLDVFASGSSVDRSKLYMYDTAVDAINDISGMDLGLHQRWQTQHLRASREIGTGVDVLTLDLDLALFTSKPTTFGFLNPGRLPRGLLLDRARKRRSRENAINANATWRLTDNTVVLADAQYNIDYKKLATSSLSACWCGATCRNRSTSGDRYIADLNLEHHDGLKSTTRSARSMGLRSDRISTSD